MIACDSYLSLFFFALQKKKLRSGAIVRFSDNSSYQLKMYPFLTFGYRFSCRADKQCYRHDRRSDSLYPGLTKFKVEI